MAIVQDPADALYPSMPTHARAHVAVDYCVPAAEIGRLLVQLTSQSVQERAIDASAALKTEVRIASGENARDAGMETIGVPSTFACPECHGTLMQLTEGQRTRFRCHTGHAYSIPSLSVSVSEAIDEVLWTTIRAIDESGRLLLHVADHHTSAAEDARQLHTRAGHAFEDAEALRRVAQQRGAREGIVSNADE